MELIFSVPDHPIFARYFVREVMQGAALGCRPLFVGEHALPPLYSIPGVRYQWDPGYGSGVERMPLPGEVFRAKGGDCNALVLYEVARRQAARQKDAVSIADWTGTGGMHAQIRRPDGEIEDPSVRLGAPVNWPRNFLYDLKGNGK